MFVNAPAFTKMYVLVKKMYDPDKKGVYQTSRTNDHGLDQTPQVKHGVDPIHHLAWNSDNWVRDPDKPHKKEKEDIKDDSTTLVDSHPLNVVAFTTSTFVVYEATQNHD